MFAAVRHARAERQPLSSLPCRARRVSSEPACERGALRETLKQPDAEQQHLFLFRFWLSRCGMQAKTVGYQG